jgi:pimeloyl-ACP methyl ester carboxylesterase
MSDRSDAQSWVVNTLLAGNGYEVLHPESRHFLAEIGYDPVDFDRALAKVKTVGMMPKAWSEVGLEIERKAAWYEEQGFSRAAHDLYLRACLLFGHAQYSFAPSDARKAVFRAAVNRCTEKVVALADHRMERVEIPFEGRTLYGIAHYPGGVEPAPLAILMPGMDMYKEDWTKVAAQYYVPRGIAVIAVDGPGQGESFGNGLLVSAESNYERAISTFIDHMVAKPEIDGERVAIWGVSMGSYWGLRTAAFDKRVKGVATAMGCYGNMETIFEKAQPGFKANFMRMTGYTDERTFDVEVAQRMGVSQLAGKIECPVLMAYGEFDELSTLPETIELFEQITAPKRLMVFEQEFHALGGVAAELIGSAADWIEAVFAGKLAALSASQDYIGRDGRIGRGSALPPWWSNQAAL